MQNMKKEQVKPWKFLFGIFMVIIYLGMASLLVFSNMFDIREPFRIIIGILFFLYGIFRGYRIWKPGY